MKKIEMITNFSMRKVLWNCEEVQTKAFLVATMDCIFYNMIGR